MEHSAKQVAVVGSGYWGKNLVRNFYQLETLKWVCDQNETILRGFKNQYPDIEITTSYRQILEDPDVEGIVVATPAETHYSLAKEGLLAGKHLYVEKPLVLHEKEGLELIRLAEENERLLMVGHLLQYHPGFIKLKELVDGGELGRINYIYSNRLNLGKIRREENILWSFAPHDISMILALTGEMPEWVMATGGNYLHQKIADVTTTHLEFPTGIRGHIFVSWLHPIKEQKLVVVGSEKMAVFDDMSQEKLFVYPHKIEFEEGNIPVAHKADREVVEFEPSQPLEEELKHFVRCIADRAAPKTDGNEGVRVLRILNKAGYFLK
jgi:UDP-2-acetamido-3-amino-2,3-dideoxy-glucuronate N-acetyltransferase